MSLSIFETLYSQSGRFQEVASALSDEFAGREWSQAPAPVYQFFENIESPTKLRSVSAWKARLRHNTRLFQTNYMILVACFLVFYVVTHPLSVMLMVAVAAGCITAASPKPDIHFQGRVLTIQERMVGAAAISTMCLCVFGVLSSLSFNLMMASGVVLTHATVRRVGTGEKIEGLKKRLQNDMKEKIEEVKEALD